MFASPRPARRDSPPAEDFYGRVIKRPDGGVRFRRGEGERARVWKIFRVSEGVNGEMGLEMWVIVISQ